MLKRADTEKNEEMTALLEEHDVDNDTADLVVDLLNYIDFAVDDIKSIKEGTPIEVTVGSQEYIIYSDYTDAEDAAKESVLDLMDDIGLEGMNGWEDFVDKKECENYFRRAYTEWTESDVYELTEDELEKMLKEWEADDEEELVEMMVDNKIDEGNGGLDYWRFNFGEEEATKLLIDNNLIDIGAYAKWAIEVDGVAHNLSTYDGEELDLKDGAVAYRVN